MNFKYFAIISFVFGCSGVDGSSEQELSDLNYIETASESTSSDSNTSEETVTATTESIVSTTTESTSIETVTKTNTTTTESTTSTDTTTTSESTVTETATTVTLYLIGTITCDNGVTYEFRDTINYSLCPSEPIIHKNACWSVNCYNLGSSYTP